MTSGAAGEALKKCLLCPRRCGADRTKGEHGYCRAGADARVYSYSAHHGEEPVLSGRRGSGTIFFSHCNMKCVYCQNYYFSQLDEGEDVSVGRLIEMMLALQGVGCHNINLVSPTHYAPQIKAALEGALEDGLKVPVVYNTGGYDLARTIRSLEGLVDIYMPDMRYSSDSMAEAYSDAVNYVECNRIAVEEMHRQVGDLVVDNEGVARRGLIIRLLVLPNDISGTKDTIRFIAKRISKGTFLSIMSQYYPTFRACNYRELSSGVTKKEYLGIVDEAKDMGLDNGWVQEIPAEVDTKYAGTSIRPHKPVG